MSPYEQVLISGAIGFGFGILSGVLMEKWRERLALRRKILDDYLSMVAKDGIKGDDYRSFGALQKVGAWRLNDSEIKDFRDEITGRGYLDPCIAWQGCFPEMKSFPREFLKWAKNKNIDFLNEDETMKAIAEEYDSRNIPKSNAVGITWL